MTAGSDFRAAVEAHDLEAMSACLADDVEFFSPVAFKPFVSKPVVTALLGFVGETFEDFVYVDDIEQGNSHMLRFSARVGDKAIVGVDLMEMDEDGLIKRFSVMIRPLSAAHAMADAMSARFEAAGGKPGA